MAWFDDPKNQVGALTARLASDASMVRGATGSRLSTLVEALSNIGIAVLISFIFGWKLAFVTIGFFPIMVIAGVLQGKILMGFSRADKNALENGGKLASECITNIRTVASLTKESTFIQRVADHFYQMYRFGVKRSHIVGVCFSFSQSVTFFAYAAVFTFGAYLVQQREMDFISVFRVFSAVIFGAQALGRTSSYAPDYAKARVSAARLFNLMDKVSKIDPTSTDGEKPDVCIGSLSFNGVSFSYPNRANARVLQKLDFSVQNGERLAFVGASGCGKSTSVQLIERFYDCQAGQILIDGHDVTNLNIGWLRAQIGIVSQEPVLFDASIRDNIVYGDNSREIPMDEVIQASRAANIHNFVQSLTHGYDTNVGEKGTQLSGGQKQRIAIARALIRNPKILLLDEATSALDTESEKVVQEALDVAQKGRTCIVVAHRLSTIQDANKIAVFHRGHIAECGNHVELMSMKGFYYQLQQAQHRKEQV